MFLKKVLHYFNDLTLVEYKNVHKGMQMYVYIKVCVCVCVSIYKKYKFLRDHSEKRETFVQIIQKYACVTHTSLCVNKLWQSDDENAQQQKSISKNQVMKLVKKDEDFKINSQKKG